MVSRFWNASQYRRDLVKLRRLRRIGRQLVKRPGVPAHVPETDLAGGASQLGGWFIGGRRGSNWQQRTAAIAGHVLLPRSTAEAADDYFLRGHYDGLRSVLTAAI
jgi:hypothetical protein